MSKRVTIGQLATELGLSKTATSYALRGLPGVSAATQERAQNLARERGWVPSAAARALSSSRVGAIGVVIRRDPELLGKEAFYMNLLSGVESALSDTDDALLLRMVKGDVDEELATYRKWSAQRRVDGVLVSDLRQDDPRPAELSELGMPYVMIGDRASLELGPTAVTNDVAGESDQILDHLASLGHRRVLHIAGPDYFLHETEREQALAQSAERHGIAIATVHSSYMQEDGERLVRDLVLDGDRSHDASADRAATAVVTSNDLLAVGVATALERAARDDIAVISWDDSVLCDVHARPITALARFPESQGMRGAQYLLALIQDSDAEPDPPRPAELRVRATSVPAGPSGA